MNVITNTTKFEGEGFPGNALIAFGRMRSGTAKRVGGYYIQFVFPWDSERFLPFDYDTEGNPKYHWVNTRPTFRLYWRNLPMKLFTQYGWLPQYIKED